MTLKPRIVIILQNIWTICWSTIRSSHRMGILQSVDCKNQSDPPKIIRRIGTGWWSICHGSKAMNLPVQILSSLVIWQWFDVTKKCSLIFSNISLIFLISGKHANITKRRQFLYYLGVFRSYSNSQDLSRIIINSSLYSSS